MKRKNNILLVLFIVLVTILTGCSVQSLEDKNTQANINKAKNIIIADLLATAENKSDHSLVDISCSLKKFNKYNMPIDIYNRITVEMDISDVSEDIGINTLRKVGNGYYSIHTIDIDKNNKAYGFIMYEENGRIIDGWCTDIIKNRKNFENIAVGDDIHKVYSVDPYYCYLENNGDNNATTYHKLSNGKQLIINYTRENKNSDFLVTTIKSETDTIGFTDMLLKKDFKLIENK